MSESMHCILHRLTYCFDHALHLYLELNPHHSLTFFREFFAGFYEDNRKGMSVDCFLVVPNLSMMTGLFSIHARFRL
jgi:hypothetical protein